MGKVLYALGAVALGFGLLDAFGISIGPYRAADSAVLLWVGPVLLVGGFLAPRKGTQKCPMCAERIDKTSLVCEHCGADLTESILPQGTFAE